MAKRSEVKEEWLPRREAVTESRADGPALTKTLAGLKGMNGELAERMVNEGDWPAGPAELASRYGLAQMDAEAVLKVLNENR